MSVLSPARKVALQTLIYAREHNSFACDVVYTMCDRNNLSPSDRAFCTKLVRGVAGHEICLDSIINRFLKSKISPSVRDALRISAYEILYLNKDSHVAVSQGVELVKSVAKKASGLANAVLRKVCDENLPDELALRNGFSKELSGYIEGIYGKTEAEEFYELSELEPPLQYSYNYQKQETLCNLNSKSVIGLAKRGDVIIADESAQAISKYVATACKENSVSTLLEVGAGRGTKTALVESYLFGMAYKLEVHDCLDSSKARLSALKEKADLCNFDIDNVFCEDATKVKLEKKYDVVFIDSPCSGLGTLRRHPEIKSRVTCTDIKNCAKLSLSILNNVSKFVNSGGLLFYSTCTITPEENEEVISNFLNSSEGKRFEFSHTVREAKLTNLADAHFCVCLKCKM